MSAIDLRPRVEHDAIGPVEIPVGALYGPRTERARRLRVGTTTLGDRPEVLSVLGRVKEATAIANRRAGTLEPTIARSIEQAARLLATGCIDGAHFPVDPLLGGGWVAVNANVNEVLATVATSSLDSLGAEANPGGRFSHPRTIASRTVDAAEVNRSQSTADVCHTASRLAVHAAAGELAAEVGRLTASLDRAARAADEVTTLSRTCLQDALPIAAGQRLHGSAAAIRRSVDELALAARPLLLVTLGATVVGDGAGAPAAYREAVVPALAEVTGSAVDVHPSPPSALQHSDDLHAVSSATDRLARAAGKLAGDLRLLASGPLGGLGELQLPHVLDGSTYFTDKRNPVVPETVINAVIEVSAHHHAVQAAGERAELDLNVFDGLAALHVLDALAVLRSAVHRLRTDAIDGLVVDRARCEHLALSVIEPQETTT